MKSSERDELKSRARGISLGLYAGDLGALRETSEQAARWGGKIAHFDEMDGSFVPAMVGGPGFVQAVGNKMLRDVHMMVEAPSRHVGAYVKAGADIITIHAESPDPAGALRAVRDAPKPVLAGLGLMPTTPLEAVRPLLKLAPDLVLVLSLDPRDGQAADITSACARVHALRELCEGFSPLLAFDGGVTLDSIDEIAAARPDVIVSGSAVMKSDTPETSFQTMHSAWQRSQT